ncbi:terminase [Mycolicibacterium brisbanense]|uniref:hypothetical protein n=1 Tax=Mycolicibacterium brisbanense TaxID=146020 RepID=UPI0007C8E6D1|nr:hypothetical protein [Mycolicibacterium brisbanense]MCV7158029.1 terminase [Mycolicibacterium brisbanense]
MQARLLSVGIEFDPWQQGFGMVSLGLLAPAPGDEVGKYASSVGGNVASIPRQVGKTFTVGAIHVGLCLEFPGFRCAWTSHHNRTTTNTFRSIQGLVRRRAIQPFLAPDRSNGIRTANGEQEIQFANGSVFMFGARSEGFGRGMDKIDSEVFDEAQILGLKALEDMVPAINQAQNPHGGLLWFTGTPPRPVDDGEAFTAKRDQALSGRSKKIFYVEFSADPDSKPDDVTQYPIMNPSFPHRTPMESMERMRENIPNDDSWNREARGIWPKTKGGAIDAAKWGTLIDGAPEFVGTPAIGIDRSPDGLRWVICAAWRTAAGRVHLETSPYSFKSSLAVVEKITELVTAWDPCAIVIDGRSPAASLQEKLIAAHVEPEIMSTGEWVRACGALYDDINDSHASHSGQKRLTDSVGDAGKRDLMGGFAWDLGGKAPITPINAATAAHYGLMRFAAPPKVTPPPPLVDAELEAISDEFDPLTAPF